MQQLRLTTLQSRDMGSPLSRLVVTATGIAVVLGVLAMALFVVVPILGVILSAAVGGMILALTGLMLMIPLFLLAGSVLAFVSRGQSRRSRS